MANTSQRFRFILSQSRSRWDTSVRASTSPETTWRYILTTEAQESLSQKRRNEHSSIYRVSPRTAGGTHSDENAINGIYQRQQRRTPTLFQAGTQTLLHSSETPTALLPVSSLAASTNTLRSQTTMKTTRARRQCPFFLSFPFPALL